MDRKVGVLTSGILTFCFSSCYLESSQLGVPCSHITPLHGNQTVDEQFTCTLSISVSRGEGGQDHMHKTSHCRVGLRKLANTCTVGRGVTNHWTEMDWTGLDWTLENVRNKLINHRKQN